MHECFGESVEVVIITYCLLMAQNQTDETKVDNYLH